MATVDYFINLAGNAIQMAEQFVKAFSNIQESATSMGAGVDTAEAALNTLGSSFDRAAGGAAALASKMQGMKPAFEQMTLWTANADKASQSWYDSQARIEKMQLGMLERQEAKRGLQEQGLIPADREGGLGFMGGLFALSTLHNDVLKSWEGFDEEIRRIRGTAAGQLSDSDIQELRASALKTAQGTIFTGADIAKIMLAEVERGVPVNQRTKNGDLLGAVIARQMLGIATGTGEDPSETFKTHLAIQRGFELPFEAFPHISDTIARIHQKTGISLKQIETQMGQIASYAHASGWTEEQTVGAVGYLAKRGMGQYAGSGLARLISKSQAWSKPAAEFWKSLGIGKEDLVDKATGGMIAPDAMMQLLQDHTKGMRQADVAAAFSKMFGDRGVKIASALLGGDPAELRQMIIDLQDVDGLAEKMGVEGSKGGVAGLKKFSAAWENLKQAVGESGFGDHVGWLAGKFGDLFDAVAGGPKGGAEAVGWLAQGLNVVSSAALPLLALSMVGPQAWGGLKSLGSTVLGLKGLGSIATDAAAAATALRSLSMITGVGLAIGIGVTVWQNWDKVAAAIERVAAALAKIRGGKWTEGLGDLWNTAKDVNQKLGDAAGQLPGTPDPNKVKGLLDYANEKPKDPRFQQPHGRFGPGFHSFGGTSDAGAVQANRVQIDSRVKVDPIQIHIPSSITVNVTGPGLSGTGSIPLSSSAPRGQALPEGDQHH